MGEYEVMVSHTYVWTKTIKAASQEEADMLAELDWHEGEFTKPNSTTGATSPIGWNEVSSVSGEFEVL